MASYPSDPGSGMRDEVDWREVEREALDRAFTPGYIAAMRVGGGMPSAISPLLIGRSDRKAAFDARWPKLTPKLRGRCPPSAVWSVLVELEPALECFPAGGRASRERLIARCEMILETHPIWSRALALSSDAAEYIAGVVRDALALLCAAQERPRRKRSDDGSSAWRYTWSDLGFCSLCWHLVPPSPQTGFHAHGRKRAGDGAEAAAASDAGDRFRFRGHDALCVEHKACLGAPEKRRWTNDQALRPVILDGPSRTRPTWHGIMPEAIAAGAQNAAAWAALLRSAFPETARAYPHAAHGLTDAMRIMSGLSVRAVDTLIATVGAHEQRAGLTVLTMLVTCEKILLHRLQDDARARGDAAGPQTVPRRASAVQQVAGAPPPVANRCGTTPEVRGRPGRNLRDHTGRGRKLSLRSRSDGIGVEAGDRSPVGPPPSESRSASSASARSSDQAQRRAAPGRVPTDHRGGTERTRAAKTVVER